ncbi:MAG: MFS transporter [Fimbriimonadales bacterium]|nr:MFS transporter [Fimbriimonadales bacterium]
MSDSLESVSDSPVKSKLSNLQHLTISSFWFATNFHWGAILLLLLPGDIETLLPNQKAQALGLIVSLGALPALLVPLISGALSDRCTRPEGRRKPYIATGVLVNVFGLLGMALGVSVFKSVPLYCLAYVLVQVGNNIATGAYMGVIPDIVPENERGKASGFMALMTQLGTLVGAVAVGMLLGKLAPLMKYGAIMGVMLIVGAWTYFGIQEKQHTNKDAFDFRAYLKSLWIDPKKYPDFAWVWITRFLVMLGFYAIQPFIKYYLVDVVGVERDKVDSVAPQLLGIILIVSSFTGYYGGKLSDKIGRKKVVFLANGLITVVAPLFILCHDVKLALVVGALFGFGYGAYISVDYALGTDVLPEGTNQGKDMAVWHVAMTLPQTLMAPIAGWLISLPGKSGVGESVRYTTEGYASIFVVCSICFAFGAYLLRNVKSVS